MEKFHFTSAVRGYHVYKHVWRPSIGEKPVAQREFYNPMDKLEFSCAKEVQMNRLKDLLAKKIQV